jgi:hypothetical protein
MRTLTATTKVFASEYSGIGPKELVEWTDEQLADRMIYSRSGNMDGWTQIGTATVSVELLESEQVIACAVESLKAELQKTLADAEVKANMIREKIQNLLCLENKS